MFSLKKVALIVAITATMVTALVDISTGSGEIESPVEMGTADFSLTYREAPQEVSLTTTTTTSTIPSLQAPMTTSEMNILLTYLEAVEEGNKNPPTTTTILRVHETHVFIGTDTFVGYQAENRATGQEMAAERGWTGDEWNCLDWLWGIRESGWDHLKWNNAGSGAYGIPQALPADKMASHGADWLTNPRTQIAWGLDYIASRYGMPCSAAAHSRDRGWY